jgi:pimeloyl-ACP methyl ester carboxylesterase
LGGVLADWQLPSSTAEALAGLPTLVIRGERGEVSAGSTQVLLEGPLARAATQLLEVPKAGTMVHIDAYERVLQALDEHVTQHDAPRDA